MIQNFSPPFMSIHIEISNQNYLKFSERKVRRIEGLQKMVDR